MNQSESDVKYIHNAYAPYLKEGLYCRIIDIVIAVSIVLLLLLAKAGWFILPILPLFILCTFCVNHLTMLRIAKDIREDSYETATVEILSVREIHSPAGYWGTILHEIHPKTLRVGRYKILCRTKDGQKLTLQCIMSEPRVQDLRDGIDRGLTGHCAVIYGQRSRILCGCTDRGQWADAINQKI